MLAGRFHHFAKGRPSGAAALPAHNEEREAFRVWGAEELPEYNDPGRKARHGGKGLNKFREWLSDNLRYIGLILGILAALVAMFFGIRAIAGKFGGRLSSLTDSKNKTVSSSVTGSVVTSAESASSSVVSVVSSAESAASSDGGALTENDADDVSNLINSYYAALNARDFDKLADLVDVLTDEKKQDINNEGIGYSYVTVYSKTGLTKNSYVVYATYSWQKQGMTSVLPGLDQLYVKKAKSGSLEIVLSALDAKTQAYVDQITQTSDVQALYATYQTNLSAATASSDQAAAESEAAAESQAAAESAAQAAAESAAAQAAAESQAAQAAAESAAAQAAAESAAAQAAAESAAQAAAEQAAQEQAALAAAAGGQATRQATIVSDCFLRAQPNGTVITTLHAGDSVYVIGDVQNGWYHIWTPSYSGYCGKSFVS